MGKKVAIQGGLGSFHHQAARKIFGESHFDFVDKDHFREVTQAVENEEVKYGVIAVENSIAGSILPNYNLIHKHNLFITNELFMPISQNLITLNANVKIDEIEKVYSHPIALLQCDDFLEAHPNMVRMEYEDTAKSAQKIKEESLTNAAAIASEIAAEIYGLHIAKREIQTFKHNTTRFVVLQKEVPDNQEYDKVSIRFSLSHETGSLANALMQFSVRRLSLSKIQSLPIPKKPWQYMFYIDVLISDFAQFKEAIAVLKIMSEDFLIFGKYKNDKQI